MAKKCKCPPEGAPQWVMTYGDMMSLLLVFFIMLTAISKIPKEDVDPVKTQEVREGFGFRGGGGQINSPMDPTRTIRPRPDAESLHNKRRKERSNTLDPGMDGPEADVTTIREGERFAVGGRVMFEPESADLSEAAKGQLRVWVQREELEGKNNLIEVRGHAARGELGEGHPEFSDLWELSHARAKAVMRYLTSDEVGLRRERFRLIANADREPLAPRAYTTRENGPNRRVEIFLTESLVDQYTQAESGEGR